jgi:plastocyanin
MLKGLLLRPALPGVALFTVAVAAVFGVIALSALSSPFGSGPAEAATVTVRVGDNWFCDPTGPQPCTQPHDTTVSVGDTVTWEWGASGGGTTFIHTTTHCADDFSTCSEPREWDSSPAKTSGTFSWTFGSEDAGKTFLYRCQVHPLTMRGRIIVQGPATPTPAPTPTPTPTPIPVGGIADFPDVEGPAPGSAASYGSSSFLYAALAVGLAAAIVALAGVAWYLRRPKLRP